jgi:anti-anti-sigma factor
MPVAPETPDTPDALGSSDVGVLIRLQGPLDAVSAAEIPHRVRASADRHRHVVIDLSEVQLLGAAAVSALVHLHQGLAREGRRLHVLAPEGAPARALGVMRSVEMLDVHPSLEAALGPGSPRPRVVDLRTADDHVGSAAAQQAELELGFLTVSSCQEVRPMLLRLSQLAVRAVPGVEAVSVALGSPTAPELVVTSSVAAQAADGLQFAAGRGPTVDAFKDDVPVLSQDAAADPRWPALGDLIGRAATQVRAVLAIPLHVPSPERTPVGVLTLYGSDGEALTTPATGQAAERVAARAAGLVREAGLIEQLGQMQQQMRQALSSRAEIDQAKGIIMREMGCDADEAFSILRGLSSRDGRKVRDVARQIVAGAGLNR